MKHIFVGLIASLAFVALTQAASLFEERADSDACPSKVCGKRQDGFCQYFEHTCQMNNVNCMLDYKKSRTWTQTDYSECSKLSATTIIGVCASICPLAEDCNSVGQVNLFCGANTSGTKCKVYEGLCNLQADACKDIDVFPAVSRRCKATGLIDIGATGTCGPKYI